MGVKEVKHEVYKVVCPVCGKAIYAISEAKAIDRLDAHLAEHEREREAEKGEETSQG